jgi:DNA-directed RNA polymerase beta subunit
MSKTASKKDVLAKYKKNDYGRVLLADQRKLASFPDLLDAQKKGFDQFLNQYIHELFGEILPIQYTAGDQTITLDISDITLEPPTISVDEAKRAEKNYAGVLK